MMTGQNVFSASEPQHEIIEQVSTAERNDGLIRKLSSLWEESVRATHHFLKENDIENLKPYVTIVRFPVEIQIKMDLDLLVKHLYSL